MGDNFNILCLQKLFGYCSADNMADGNPSASTASSVVVVMAVFHHPSEIAVGWTWSVFEHGIVFGFLVFVEDNSADWCSVGFSFKYA